MLTAIRFRLTCLSILPKNADVALLNTSFCLFSGCKTYLLLCERLSCGGYSGPGRSGEEAAGEACVMGSCRIRALHESGEGKEGGMCRTKHYAVAR